MMRVIRAYPALLRVGFAAAVAYRAEMLIWMLTMTMPLVSLALWSAVAEAAPVGRFTQPAFVAYFLGSVVVRQLSGSWVVWELIQEIKTGTLATRLLKPIHPLIAYSADSIAAIPLRAVFAFPFAAFAVARGGGHVANTPLLALAFLLSLGGAWVINYFTMCIIGSMSFFMESSGSVFDVWFASFMLLSGYLVPVELFPGWLRRLSYVLPFRYTLGFPVEVLIGMSAPSEIARGLLVQGAYCVAACAAALALWRAGVRRFAAYGG